MGHERSEAVISHAGRAVSNRDQVGLATHYVVAEAVLMASEQGTETIAVVDGHDAIHAAVELWCAEAQPPIRVRWKLLLG